MVCALAVASVSGAEVAICPTSSALHGGPGGRSWVTPAIAAIPYPPRGSPMPSGTPTL
jgi:hypothetical protein